MGAAYAAYMIWLLCQPVVVIDGVRYPPAEFGHVLSKFPWAIIHGIPALIIWSLFERWREMGRNVVVGQIVHQDPETGMTWMKVDWTDRELPYDGPAAEFVWETYVGATSGMPWESKTPEETNASISAWIKESSEAQLNDLKFVAMTPEFFADGQVAELGFDVLGSIMALSHRERDIPGWSDFSELLSDPTGKLAAVRAFDVLVTLDHAESERVSSFLRPFLEGAEREHPYFWVGLCTVYGSIGDAEALSVLRHLGESLPDDPEAVDMYKTIIDDVRIKLGIAL